MEGTSMDKSAQYLEGSPLPPDGTIVYVSPWRRRIAWVCTAGFVYLNLAVAIKSLQLGGLVGIGLVFFSAILIVFVVRLPLSGMILGPQGIKVRSAWWTNNWCWDEISRFELLERGNSPRLRIHLRNGRIKKAVGFFARSPAQEERCQAMFRALEERLEAEQAKRR